MENVIHPLRRYAPRRPCLRGTVSYKRKTILINGKLPFRLAVGTLRAASDNKNNIHPYPTTWYSPCLRGAVCWRGGGGRCTQRPYC